MNLAAIRDVVTSKTARQILLVQKHSPKILFAAGAIGFVGTVVLACRATLKTNAVLDNHDFDAKKIEAKVEGRNQFETLSEEEGNRQKRRLQIDTATKIARLYLPAIGLGVVTVGALTGSHVILTKRNGALMATAAGLSQAYKQYREQVAEEYGADVDQKFALGGQTISIEEKTAEGKVKLRESVEISKDGQSGSPYRFLFDPVNSRKWSPEPGRNAMTLQMEQSWMNDRLRAQKHLFLNEVLDRLGIPRTKAGAVVGWVYRHDTEEKNGDNYVDFGIYTGDLERAEAFVDGAEHSVWLNFNVDGVILDLI